MPSFATPVPHCALPFRTTLVDNNLGVLDLGYVTWGCVTLGCVCGIGQGVVNEISMSFNPLSSEPGAVLEDVTIRFDRRATMEALKAKIGELIALPVDEFKVC